MTQVSPRTSPGVQAAEVYLIRHGETEWSVNGRHTGRTDIPLTENGRQVAKRWQPYAAAKTFALVLTSPLQRARQTCELVGLAQQAEIDRDLVEWDYGAYEGLTRQEIRALAAGVDDFQRRLPERGESAADRRSSGPGDRASPCRRRPCGAVRARARIAPARRQMAGPAPFRGRALSARHGNALCFELVPRSAGPEALEFSAHGER